MNIIIISMEGCGASSIAPIISQMHEVFYGKRIQWLMEISRVIASSNEYLFPEGFTSVYYVDPKMVLERPFDKVIILQRPFNEIKKGIYARLNIPKNKKIEEKMKFYYHLIYEQELEDERLYRVNLQDFADYPVATFSDLFDFLGYPKQLRPIIFPYPIWHHPEGVPLTPDTPKLRRDWIKRSSILRKGHEEGNFEKEDYTQVVNIPPVHAYKLAPVEFHYQEGTVYRIGRDTIDTLEVLGLV